MLDLRLGRALAALACCCGVLACEQAGFESLGTRRPSLRPETRDAGHPSMQLDAARPDAAMPAIAGNASAAPSPVDAGMLAAGSGAAGSGQAGVAGSQAGMSGSGGMAAPNPLTGALGGMPFTVKSAFAVENVGELGWAAVYLLDSPMQCDGISSLAWLKGLPSSTHVIEISFPSTAATGSVVGMKLVSYAKGGSYSFTKTYASSSTLLLSENRGGGVVEGTLTASFSSGSVMGMFHADACATGTSF